MDLSIFFAGTGGSVPTARRGLPALLIQRGGDRLLFDCGEGTQRQLVRSIGLPDIEHLFITHLHLDHWLGLPGMIKSFDLRDRDRPLRVHGPAGLAELMGVLRAIHGRLGYELSVHELEPGEAVGFDGYTVTPFAVAHRTRAFGYALVEEPRTGHLDAGLAERLGVSPGPDFGRLQRGETVNGVAPDRVLGPDRPGRKVVVSGDTAPCEAVGIAAHQAQVLVHEATFAEEEAQRARQTGHTTARQAAELARDAEVTLLALTHLSTRYAGSELRDEARTVFAAAVVPRDFESIDIPLPEKGAPRLVRGGPAPAPRERAQGERAQEVTGT